MLDDTIKTQLKAYLERLQRPIELVASLDDGDRSVEMRTMLDEIGALSERVAVRHDGADARRPSFTVGCPGDTARIRFAGLPMGHEFADGRSSAQG